MTGYWLVYIAEKDLNEIKKTQIYNYDHTEMGKNVGAMANKNLYGQKFKEDLT
jgi:hypothetical protein